MWALCPKGSSQAAFTFKVGSYNVRRLAAAASLTDVILEHSSVSGLHATITVALRTNLKAVDGASTTRSNSTLATAREATELDGIAALASCVQGGVWRGPATGTVPQTTTITLTDTSRAGVRPRLCNIFAMFHTRVCAACAVSFVCHSWRITPAQQRQSKVAG